MAIDLTTAAKLTEGALSSFHPFRTLMPYCVTAVAGGWVFENRWYAPLGSSQSAAAVPIPLHTFRFKKWPGDIEGVWHRQERRVDSRFYLYNDGAESRQDYFPRLERLMTFIKALPIPARHQRQHDNPQCDFADWVTGASAPDILFGREVFADVQLRRELERPDDKVWNSAHRKVLDRILLDYLLWLTSGKPLPRKRQPSRGELEQRAAACELP
jgi:hypothetical protein